MSADPKVILSCGTWTLNLDDNTKDSFWYQDTYNISLWEKCLKFNIEPSNLVEDDVWHSYIEFQINKVFKACTICNKPEVDDTLKMCCYCSQCVHEECSVVALPENILYKKGNEGFENHMRICFSCAGVAYEPTPKEAIKPKRLTSASKAIQRLLTLPDLPTETRDELNGILKEIQTHPLNNDKYMEQVKNVATKFFQSPYSLEVLEKKNFPTKGGIGVVAKKNIPKYTVIGVYPGYPDFSGSEPYKFDRPEAKYSLMDLNCADFFNFVFPEFDGTFTPFINEPTPTQKSNCSWIQERHRETGWLSVMTVRDIEEGEELLIGYGPVYPRQYEYRYDAYAFHEVAEYKNPICYALWYWPSREEKDAKFITYIAYCPETRLYREWEEEK